MHSLKIIMKKFLTLLLLSFGLVLGSVSAQTFDYENIAPHPRLLLSKGDVTKMRALPSKQANAKLVHDKIVAAADGFLSAEPLRYKVQGEQVLEAADEALRRIFYLSYAFVMTEDMRYVAAAERDMLAASAFEDWNPSHFTDVAKMTMALSIGYDWLYRRLSVHSRSIIGTAIFEKGLRQSEGEGVTFWNVDQSDNQVCTAGLIYGALATLERSPEYCKALIAKCMESNKQAQKMYEPHGVYAEGYQGWAYGSGFEALLSAALTSSLGNDAGISSHKSFIRSAAFINHLVAPSGLVYNFGDCTLSKGVFQPEKYWFARSSGDVSLVSFDEQLLRKGEVAETTLLPLYMLCAITMDLSHMPQPTEKVWCSTGDNPFFIYRSGWNEGSAYFAIKGGGASPHSDAGSFVYEFDGVRWAVDMGDKCDTPAQTNRERKQQSARLVFKRSAEAHNTLTFKGQPHSLAAAKITGHSVTSRERSVELDLTPIFAGSARRVTRLAKVDKRNHLSITDHVENNSQHAKVEWHMATNAEAEIVAPNIISLTQDGKTIYLRLKTRGNSIAKIWKAESTGDNQVNIDGLSRVGFVVDVKAGESIDINVSLSPIKSNVISRLSQIISRKKDK